MDVAKKSTNGYVGNKPFQTFVWQVLNIGMRMYFHIEVIGRENIPEGGCVVCVNHSNYSDPPLAALALGSKSFPAIMAKKELFQSLRLFANLISSLGAFPINREAADLTAIKTALKAIKGGQKLLIFPEGTRRRGEEDLAAKEGAALLAAKSRAPVLPIYLTENKKFRTHVRMIIGKPFFVTPDKTAEHPYRAASDQIIHTIYALKEGDV